MRIGLLLPLNLSFAPYLKIYTDILDQLDNVQYDIIYPDKKGLNEPSKHRFDVRTEDKVGKISKIIYYYRYSRFLKRTLKQEKYDKLIVFGQQIAVFLYDYLCKDYKGRFIMDYRDLGLDQKCKRIFKKVLDSCAYIVLSSPGFKKYLPQRNDYVLSHNFNINILRQALNDIRTSPYQLTKPNNKIEVLTIGSIRDYVQNCAVIQALGNNESFHLTFAGRGYAAADIEKYAHEHNIKNISFTGFYEKSHEPGIIAESTFLNIFYPLRPTHATAISNRFYNSIFFRKPMITTIGTIQGELTEKYGLGIAITDTHDLDQKLSSFYEHFDSMVFEKQRLALLNAFRKDYDLFEETIKEFTKC